MHHINDGICTVTPLHGVSLVEIYGQERVLIENHRGIVCYEEHEIHVEVDFGVVIISGDKLSLRNMSKSRLIITGKICTVNLHGR